MRTATMTHIYGLVNAMFVIGGCRRHCTMWTRRPRKVSGCQGIHSGKTSMRFDQGRHGLNRSLRCCGLRVKRKGLHVGVVSGAPGLQFA
jgi:hypothetical protein